MYRVLNQVSITQQNVKTFQQTQQNGFQQNYLCNIIHEILTI